jgi:hypothetical protein
MSLKSTVKNAVDIAFNKLKDLSYEATFTNKNVESFDFNSASIIDDESSYSTYGFMEVKTTKNEENMPVTKTTFTIKTDLSQDFNRYSEVSIKGENYRCSIISQDDFITILSLTRV